VDEASNLTKSNTVSLSKLFMIFWRNGLPLHRVKHWNKRHTWTASLWRWKQSNPWKVIYLMAKYRIPEDLNIQ